MATAAPSTKVVTAEARASYVHLDKAVSTIEGGVPKFSLVLLIPKTDTVTIEKIYAAEEAAKKIGKDKKWGGELPHKLKSIIHDGDEDADLKKNPEYKGHIYMSVGNTQRPGIVDLDLQPILDNTQLYSGMYVRASLNAYPYNSGGSKGVSFGLNNVQKLREGEALAGAASAEEDFGDSLL